MTLCGLLQLPEPDTVAALAALELQTSLMARAGVVVPLLSWAAFTAAERLVLAEQYEKHQLEVAMCIGSAARSAEAAAAAYAHVDGGAILVRMRLERIAEEALAK